MDKIFCCILGEICMDFHNVTYMYITGTANKINMGSHVVSFVKHGTNISGREGWWYSCVTCFYWDILWELRWEVRGSNDKKFCLWVIWFQKVRMHPLAYISNTIFKLGYVFMLVTWGEREVHLSVVEMSI